MNRSGSVRLWKNGRLAACKLSPCWTKYSLSDFKGTGNEVLIETLELVYEGMTPVK